MTVDITKSIVNNSTLDFSTPVPTQLLISIQLGKI